MEEILQLEVNLKNFNYLMISLIQILENSFSLNLTYSLPCAQCRETFGLRSIRVHIDFAAESFCISTHFLKKYEVTIVYDVTS